MFRVVFSAGRLLVLRQADIYYSCITSQLYQLQLDSVVDVSTQYSPLVYSAMGLKKNPLVLVSHFYAS